MIFEDKEYVEVEQKYAKVGDLVHITKLFGDACDIYEFIEKIDGEADFVFAAELPDGSHYVGGFDEFKTYRYVKDGENNTEKAHRELNKTIIKIDKEMINHLKKSKRVHDLINQTSKITNQTDTVNSPSHYNQTKIEAIDIIEDVTAGYQSNVKYHIGNAIKYLIRAPFKNNTVEDLKKAVWYINRAIEKLEGEEVGKDNNN